MGTDKTDITIECGSLHVNLLNMAVFIVKTMRMLDEWMRPNKQEHIDVYAHKCKACKLFVVMIVASLHRNVLASSRKDNDNWEY